MTRRLVILIVTLAAALGPAATAIAHWSAPGAGAGAGATGGLDQVTGAATSVVGTVASGTFDVSWTPLALPPGVTPTYVVERHSAAWTAVCTTSASRCTLTGVPNGSAAYRVTAGIGSWTGAASSSTAVVKVQNGPPAITDAPPAQTTSRTAAFSFTAPFASFRCRLDGGAQGACTSPQSYAGLAAGAHTFEVRAMDAYGSLTQPAAWSWTTAP